MSKTSKKAVKSDGLSRLIPLMLVAAIAMFGLSGWAWWHNIRSNPDRTLMSAVENSLRTASSTRQVKQSNGAQSMEQGVELSLSPSAVAHGFTTIKQESVSNTTISTEAISTPTVEFVRYTDIVTDQKNSKGKSLDFSKLLNIWGKTSAEQTGDLGALYGESVLGVVPVANLNVDDRQTLMSVVRNEKVYEFDEAKIERKIVNGRPTYIYPVSVKPTGYIKLLKEFGKIMNMKQLESIDPAQYADAQPMVFNLTVDVWSQRLTGITYEGDTRTETLGSYGIRRNVKLPSKSIPVAELEAKLQAVQE